MLKWSWQGYISLPSRERKSVLLIVLLLLLFWRLWSSFDRHRVVHLDLDSSCCCMDSSCGSVHLCGFLDPILVRGPSGIVKELIASSNTVCITVVHLCCCSELSLVPECVWITIRGNRTLHYVSERTDRRIDSNGDCSASERQNKLNGLWTIEAVTGRCLVV